MSDIEELNAEIRTCPKCRLSTSRTLAVPGEGPLDARIMFIGEAPGYHEDKQGRPFVGPAGQFLDELLASINLRRQDVFITNIVKCRPPANRDPQPDEIEACHPYLERQLQIIKPKMIVTLGRHSMALAFADVTISRVHGQPKRVGDIVYFPMFHPAAALHQPRYRSLIEQDMKKIPEILANLGDVDSEGDDPPRSEQLTLF